METWGMEIKETRVFNFTFIVDGVNLNFNQPAESRHEACEKLLSVLSKVCEELKSSGNQKSTGKPS